MINHQEVMAHLSKQKSYNRAVGERFEQELAKILAEHGFWVHVMQQNKAGQPADIIAVKHGFHTLIDCKVISDDKGFSFERVEENQKYAMRTFQRRADELCYFALKLPDGSVWMVSLERIETLKLRGKNKLTQNDIIGRTWSLENWLEKADPIK